MGVLSSVARSRLVAAGWVEGRDVGDQVALWREMLEAQGGFKIFPAAERALRQFGGIVVRQDGVGLTCHRQSFVVDPMVAVRSRKLFGRYEVFLGVGLYPLGRVFDGEAYLAIAEDERVFAVGEGAWYFGLGVVEAMDALLVGRMPKLLGSPIGP
ncbi:SUKH-3 domain-containing protein [Corallococcus silvisoli]|uniref:SUKH-3 domain-containing protein n=1 Tax=Corallococcus silvisoli TaxID=2697031 RepID=UPI00137683B7|nr:SUKH-3 domain-containing protein [Corallococcus silvisoli]NBD08506.1 hypothetical protein [Corallococcus silvisoli]